MVEPGIRYHYRITYFLTVRALALSSVSKDPPSDPLVIEHLADQVCLKIQIQGTRGPFMSPRAHSFQPSPLNEDGYRLWLSFSTSPDGSCKLPPLELHLILSPPYCPRSHGVAKICSPKDRAYSISTVSGGQYSRQLVLHRCNGGHFWSPNWSRMLAGTGALPPDARHVHVSPTGGIVTFVTTEEIVVRYYT